MARRGRPLTLADARAALPRVGRHALPATSTALLQDFGSMMALDGEAHRKRKAMFMSLFGPLERQRLVGLAAAQWRAAFARSQTHSQTIRG